MASPSKAAILTLWHTILHVTKGRSSLAYTSTFCGLEAVKHNHNTLETTDGNAHKLPQNQLALFTLLTYRPDTQRWRSHTLQALRELAPSLSHYRPIWSTKKVVDKCLTQASSSQTYASPGCKWTHLPEKFQFLQHQCTVRTISPYIHVVIRSWCQTINPCDLGLANSGKANAWHILDSLICNSEH